jgi:hypothetical protein
VSVPAHGALCTSAPKVAVARTGVTEVEGEVKLPDPERDDPDGWRRRFFGDMGDNFYALDTATGHDYGARISAAPLAAASSLIPQVARRR